MTPRNRAGHADGAGIEMAWVDEVAHYESGGTLFAAEDAVSPDEALVLIGQTVRRGSGR